MSRVPDPPDFAAVEPLVQTWTRGEPITRVFNHSHPPNSFNPGPPGAPPVVGRFHFFADGVGRTVPVLYGSNQEDGALSETVFHDVRVEVPDPSMRVVLASRLDSLSMVTLLPGRDLRLGQLLGFGLQRFRVEPESLTRTEPDEYPRTILWAAALHATSLNLDGLVWMSRRFDAAQALILFGDRVTGADLRVAGTPLPLAFGPGRDRVEDAANRAGIVLL